MGFDHFSWLAPWYDRLIAKKDPDRLQRLLGLPTRGWLLDAGGGTGRVAETLVSQVGAIVVADPSMGMLCQAAAKSGLHLVNTPSERLPFPDGCFEAVVMVDALHHVNHQAGTAAELFRVLKPGGRLVIEEPDIKTFVVKIVAVVEKLALMRSHFLSPKQIAALFPVGQAHVQIEREAYTAWVVVEKK